MRHRHRHRHVHYQIPIPSSTPQSLVFPYDPINRKFHTLNYQAAQTQGRVTPEEIEEFLKEVNVPIKAFYEEHPPKTGKWICLMIICTIICPLFPFLLCYLISKSNKMMEEMKKATDRAAVIVKSRGTTFTERGLLWNMPAHFPRWIELWTSVGVYGQPVQPIQTVQANQQFQTLSTYQRPVESYGAIGFPGIEMQGVPQQNYQNSFGVNNQV